MYTIRAVMGKTLSTSSVVNLVEDGGAGFETEDVVALAEDAAVVAEKAHCLSAAVLTRYAVCALKQYERRGDLGKDGHTVAIAAEVLQYAISTLLAGAVARDALAHVAGAALPRAEKAVVVRGTCVARKSARRHREFLLLHAEAAEGGAGHTLGVLA